MSASKEMIQLSKMVAQQNGWAAAKAFKAYEMNEADQLRLSQAAMALLKIFPPMAGAGALMSAALAVSLERHMQAPIQVVAGTLAVEDVPVLGDGRAFDGAQAFAEAQPTWNGHVWVMIGGYVVDISIFRTAYSADGPAALARHVDLNFGPDKALYVDQWKRTRRVGLQYVPQYVLNEDEVTRLMGGAFHLIQQAKEGEAGVA